MNKSKWITGVAVVALSATMAVAAPEGKRGGHHGRHRGGAMSERLAARLNLSDAQKDQIKAINRQFREDNKAFFESFRADMKAFRDAKQSGDTATADSLKAKLDAQRGQFKQLHEAQTQRVLSVLTPDQRNQYEQLRAERAQRREQRMEHRRGDSNQQ